MNGEKMSGKKAHLFEFGNLFLREHREHIWTGTLCASWWRSTWFGWLAGWAWWRFWCSGSRSWGGCWSFLWSSLSGGISLLGLLLLYLLLFLRLKIRKAKNAIIARFVQYNEISICCYYQLRFQLENRWKESWNFSHLFTWTFCNPPTSDSYRVTFMISPIKIYAEWGGERARERERKWRNVEDLNDFRSGRLKIDRSPSHCEWIDSFARCFGSCVEHFCCQLKIASRTIGIGCCDISVTFMFGGLNRTIFRFTFENRVVCYCITHWFHAWIQMLSTN